MPDRTQPGPRWPPPRWLRGLAAGARAIGAALLAPTCPCCNLEMGWGIGGVCEACWSEVLPGGGPACAICGESIAVGDEPGTQARCAGCRKAAARGVGPPYSAIVAWGHYDGRLRSLIHAFKFEGCTGLAGPLGDRIAGELLARGLGERLGGCRIVPVPLAADRRRRRGYDQALLLARRIRRSLRRRGLAAGGVLRALRRVRESPPQTGLARAERLASPRGTYGPARSAAGLRGAAALLVDDVLTTGATAAECSRLLLDAGAGDVIVAVAARTPARGAHARSEAGSIGGSVEID